jgi:protocatechuate 4,5-dioxygenase alpha chain
LPAPPAFDLDEPGTFLFTGATSSRGYDLNRCALTLRDASARAQFLADQTAYLKRFGLSDDVCAQVRARDWTALLEAGGHLLALLKIAATVGENLFHIGAHSVGTDAATLFAACPRRVRGLPDPDG